MLSPLAGVGSAVLPIMTSAVSSDSGISRPQNVVRTTHVQKGMQWERERLDKDMTIERKLGSGAFADVWLARHRVLGFQVAVKTILLSEDPRKAAKEREEIEQEIAVLRLCANKVRAQRKHTMLAEVRYTCALRVRLMLSLLPSVVCVAFCVFSTSAVISAAVPLLTRKIVFGF
jgi:hypothetical protein